MSIDAQFQNLSKVIAAHELYWSRVAQRNPRSVLMRDWLRREWDPYFIRWADIVTYGPITLDVLTDCGRSLSSLRELARANGVPLPDMDAALVVSGQIGPGPIDYAVSGGGHGGGHAGYGGMHVGPGASHARPARRYAPRAGFRGRGGYYRRGSKHPGRWWNGPQGVVWVESDVNLLTDGQSGDPQLDDMPPPSESEVPVDPESQGSPPEDRVTTPGDSAATGEPVTPVTDDPEMAVASGCVPLCGADSYADLMNNETNSRFWDRTGYHPGRSLDRKRDAKMIPTWLHIRMEVAQEAHQAMSEGRDWFAEQVAKLAPQGDQGADPRNPLLPFYEVMRKHETDVQPTVTSPIVSGLATAAPAPAADRLVNVAPVLAPGARPGTVQRYRDGMRLCVELCVDGQRYKGCADLSDVLGAFGQYHNALHAQMAAVGSGNGMSLMGASADAEAVCGDALLGSLADQHTAQFCAGWWHSITHAASSAVHSVESTATNTLRKLKGPITIAAATAAGAAALGIPGVGPLVAPMAASLAQKLVIAATDPGAAGKAARAIVDKAKQVAQTNPDVARAVALAHQAVAQATVGYHVAQTVANAAAGAPDAQAQVMELAQSAQAGDPAAQQAMAMAQTATQSAQNNGSGNGNDASGDAATAVQGHIPSVKFYRQAARLAAEQSPAKVVGFVAPHGNPSRVMTFNSSDDADTWYGGWMSMPHAFEYIAYFDKGDSMYPGPLNEQLGSDVVVSGSAYLFGAEVGSTRAALVTGYQTTEATLAPQASTRPEWHAWYVEQWRPIASNFFAWLQGLHQNDEQPAGMTSWAHQLHALRNKARQMGMKVRTISTGDGTGGNAGAGTSVGHWLAPLGIGAVAGYGVWAFGPQAWGWLKSKFHSTPAAK